MNKFVLVEKQFKILLTYIPHVGLVYWLGWRWAQCIQLCGHGWRWHHSKKKKGGTTNITNKATICCILVSHQVLFPKLVQVGGHYHYTIIHLQCKKTTSCLQHEAHKQLNDVCHIHIRGDRITFVAVQHSGMLAWVPQVCNCTCNNGDNGQEGRCYKDMQAGD